MWTKRDQKILYAKHLTRNVLKRQILIDSHGFKQGMSVPNFPAKSRIPIMQCFGCIFVWICLVLIRTNFKSNLNVKIHCFCHVWIKMKNVHRRIGNGNAFCWEVKVCWYFIVKYVKCSLKSQDNSTQALTPELNAFLTSVFLNDYY